MMIEDRQIKSDFLLEKRRKKLYSLRKFHFVDLEGVFSFRRWIKTLIIKSKWFSEEEDTLNSIKQLEKFQVPRLLKKGGIFKFLFENMTLKMCPWKNVNILNHGIKYVLDI